MSYRRLACTLAVLATTAAALIALTPELPGGVSPAELQAFADRTGPDALVLSGVALLTWLAWAWATLGLLLTALAALPGALGTAARVGTHVVLPASARRAAALALGVGLALSSPVLAVWSPTVPTAVAAELSHVPPAPAVPDWPVGGSAEPVPDWPSPTPSAAQHVVVRGDCLWDIAAAQLRTRTGADPTAPEIASAVTAWWTANEAVIGPDPDLLLPGQVLAVPTTYGIPR